MFIDWLIVEDDNQRHVTQKIEPRMNPVFNLVRIVNYSYLLIVLLKICEFFVFNKNLDASLSYMGLFSR